MRERVQRGFIIGSTLYVLLITVLSLVDLSPRLPESEITYLDKIAHFCFYFGLEVLLLSCVTVKKGRLCCVGIVTLLTIGYSIAIEVTQIFVGREFDLKDICANSVGALFGALLFYYCGVAFVNRVCSLNLKG